VATAPTLISTTLLADTTTSPKTSASIAVQAGDLIEVRGRTGDSTVTIATPVTTGQTYTLQQSVLVANYSAQYLWTTIAATTGNITVQLTRSAGTTRYGGLVNVWRNHGGVGASSKTNVSSGAPSLAITTTGPNSAVTCGVDDWNAVDGTTRTWRTINSITPTAGNGDELGYAFFTGEYTTYNAVWPDVGTAGTYTTGLSAPTGKSSQPQQLPTLSRPPSSPVSPNSEPACTRGAHTPWP
jgi:hypothetical protein